MSQFNPLANGPRITAFVVAAAVLLFLQLTLLLWMLLRRRADGTRTIRIMVSTLPASAAATIIGLTILGVHQGRATLFEPVTTFCSVCWECTGQCLIYSHEFFGGLFLASSALLGAACHCLGWSKIGVASAERRLAIIIGLGLGAALAALGVGLAGHAFELQHKLTTLASAEPSAPGGQSAYLAQLVGMAARTWKIATWISIAAVVIAFSWAALIARQSFRAGVERASGRAGLAGVLILVMGVVAFAATRGHRRDTARVLPPHAVGLALDASKDVVAPNLRNAKPLPSALVIAVSMPDNDPNGGVVVLDGSEVASVREVLEARHLAWSPMEKLKERLDNHQHNLRLVSPGVPGRVILVAHQSVPARVIARVLGTCYYAGFKRVHLATLREEQMSSSVLGLLHGKRGYGIEIVLTHDDENAVGLDLAQPYSAFASRVDALAGKGKVRVLVGREK